MGSLPPHELSLSLSLSEHPPCSPFHAVAPPKTTSRLLPPCQVEWRDDLRRVLKQAGAQFQPTAFLFSDTQLKDESFLEVSRRGGTMCGRKGSSGSHRYLASM